MHTSHATNTTKSALEVGKYKTFAVVDYPISGGVCLGLYSEHYRPGSLTLVHFTSETLNLQELPRYTALLVNYDLRADDVSGLVPWVTHVTESTSVTHEQTLPWAP